jgi:hypothetical protein
MAIFDPTSMVYVTSVEAKNRILIAQYVNSKLEKLEIYVNFSHSD